jgi:hypothetical protein
MNPLKISVKGATSVGAVAMAFATPPVQQATAGDSDHFYQIEQKDIHQVGNQHSRFSSDSAFGSENREFVSFEAPASSWEKADARRFKALAVKEAKGEISPEELQELDRLQKARRRLENPMSADQILAGIRREEMLNDLLSFFEKYAVRQKISH